MARIRTIKPEFTQHDELSALPAETHLFAAGLLCHSDDEGYFDGNARRLESLIFPLRESSVSAQDKLTQLASIGFIQLGLTQSGRQYGRVVKFCDHQRVNRPTPSKIRSLPIKWTSSVSAHDEITEPSLPERNGKELGKEPGTWNGNPACTEASSAPAAADPSIAIVLAPLRNGQEWAVTQADVDDWSVQYPAIDVLQQLRQMRGWLMANPRLRWSRDSVLQHVKHWLTKEHDEQCQKFSDKEHAF